MTPKVIYLLMDCETISCSRTVKNVFKAPSNIYDGSFAKIVTNVNFKPLKCIIDEFYYFSLTSISRDTVKWLLSRFIFPVIKGQCYWPWKKSFHSWKVFQSWMVCFSRFYKYLEWKPILRMKNRKYYFQLFLSRTWSGAEVKLCTWILSGMKLNLPTPVKLNLVQNHQHLRVTEPCFSIEVFKAIYSVFIFFDGCNIHLKRTCSQASDLWQ